MSPFDHACQSGNPVTSYPPWQASPLPMQATPFTYAPPPMPRGRSHGEGHCITCTFPSKKHGKYRRQRESVPLTELENNARANRSIKNSKLSASKSVFVSAGRSLEERVCWDGLVFEHIREWRYNIQFTLCRQILQVPYHSFILFYLETRLSR